MEHILNKIVQVFFLLGQPSFWNPAEPNWSYYWKQFVDKKKIGSLIYVKEIEKYCGSKTPIACVLNRLTTRDVYYRQVASEFSGYTSLNFGIHTFIEIIAHENEHVVIAEELWPNGYDKSKDSDGDFYPDWFEVSEIGKKYGFSVSDFCDSYKIDKKMCPNKLYDLKNISNPDNPAGFYYEESRCADVQLGATVDSHDHLDWSYDKNNIFQGKNFKKK